MRFLYYSAPILFMI